jgi:hypothetical protein
MSDFDKLRLQYPYQALLDQAIHNSATSALGVRTAGAFATDLWLSSAKAHAESEAIRRAMAEVELTRQMTSARQAAREMEAMRQVRDMEAMWQVARKMEEMRRVGRDMEEMQRITRDIEIMQQALANGVRQGVAEELARVAGVQKKVADALFLRQQEPHGTPQDSTNEAVDPGPEAKRTVELPPGATLLAWAQAWCSAKTVELVFEPIIADYRHEIFEALRHGWSNGAIRAIHVRYRFSFYEAIVRTIVGMVGRIIKAAKGA